MVNYEKEAEKQACSATAAVKHFSCRTPYIHDYSKSVSPERRFDVQLLPIRCKKSIVATQPTSDSSNRMSDIGVVNK